MSSQDFFKLSSPFSRDSRTREIESKNNNSKILTIYHKLEPIITFPEFILLEDFPETHKLFDTSNNLFLPYEDEFDLSLMKEVIQSYFFFKEIKKIDFNDIFKLLKIGFFLKIKPLVESIMQFIEKPFKNSNNNDKIAFILKGSLEFLSLFQEQGKQFIEPWIIKAGKNLVKRQLYDQFLSVFDPAFLTKSGSIETICDLILKNVIKDTNNDLIMKFITLFSNSLIKAQKAKNPMFRKVFYFNKIFKENLTNKDSIESTKLNKFLEDLGLSEYKETARLMRNLLGDHIEDNNKKIEDMEKEMKILKEKNMILAKTNEQFKEKQKPIPLVRKNPSVWKSKSRCLMRLFGCLRRDDNAAQEEIE